MALSFVSFAPSFTLVFNIIFYHPNLPIMNKNFYRQCLPSVFADHLFTIMGRFTVLLLFMLYSISSIGQQSYSSGTYTQDFNGLPNSGTFSFIGLGNGPFNFTAAPLNVATMNGWQLLKFTGSGSNAVFLVGTGSGNGGGAYSFGSTGSTDRAVGSLASGTVTSAFGILLTNNSGTAIGSFTITYRGEQWRNGGSNTQNKLAFSYKIGGNISGTGFTAEPLLDFVSLQEYRVINKRGENNARTSKR